MTAVSANDGILSAACSGLATCGSIPKTYRPVFLNSTWRARRRIACATLRRMRFSKRTSEASCGCCSCGSPLGVAAFPTSLANVCGEIWDNLVAIRYSHFPTTMNQVYNSVAAALCDGRSQLRWG